MKKIITYAFIALLGTACNDNKENTTQDKTLSTSHNDLAKEGHIGSIKKITITRYRDLTKISGDWEINDSNNYYKNTTYYNADGNKTLDETFTIYNNGDTVNQKMTYIYDGPLLKNGELRTANDSLLATLEVKHTGERNYTYYIKNIDGSMASKIIVALDSNYRIAKTIQTMYSEKGTPIMTTTSITDLLNDNGFNTHTTDSSEIMYHTPSEISVSETSKKILATDKNGNPTKILSTHYNGNTSSNDLVYCSYEYN